MNLSATIPPGQTEAVVNGLHQWDYGRELEIHCSTLPTIVEVHFACLGMEDAIVRVGEAVSGMVAVTIPDVCLEQTTPITAWVYCKDNDSGRTVLTITLPIIARTRPSDIHYNPEDMEDSFSELVAAVNEAVDSIKNGNVMVANAAHATAADKALQADSATSANKATYDKNGNDIANTYQVRNRGAFQPVMYLSSAPNGSVCQFKVTIDAVDCFTILTYEAGKTAQASLGWIKGSEEKHYVLTVADGVVKVWSLTPGAQMAQERSDLTVYFRQV